MYTVEGIIYTDCSSVKELKEFVAAQRIQWCETEADAERVAKQFAAEGLVDIQISEAIPSNQVQFIRPVSLTVKAADS